MFSDIKAEINSKIVKNLQDEIHLEDSIRTDSLLNGEKIITKNGVSIRYKTLQVYNIVSAGSTSDDWPDLPKDFHVNYGHKLLSGLGEWMNYIPEYDPSIQKVIYAHVAISHREEAIAFSPVMEYHPAPFEIF